MLSSYVNTPFSKFRHSARVQVQGLDLVLEHYTVLGSLEYTVPERNTILCWCPDPCARALSVKTAYLLKLCCNWLKTMAFKFYL